MSNEIIVTGGGGMVGQYFESFPNCRLFSKRELDIIDKETVLTLTRKLQPRTIVHLAAETDVDFCQNNSDTCFQINCTGAKNVAEAANEVGAHMIYISTASVFSGRGLQAFGVSDLPQPLNAYAKSKLNGELEVRQTTSNSIVIRTGWLFGGFDRDKKFVSMIAQQIWDGKKVIKAVDDNIGCPTYCKDLVECILHIAETGQTGIAHIINQGHASRFEIACEIAREIDPSVKVEKASPDEFPAFYAPRPKFEVIEPTVSLRSWQDALDEYLRNWIKIKKESSLFK